jgi:hypothetical protein
MRQRLIEGDLEALISDLDQLWSGPQAHILMQKTIQALDTRYGLGRKMAAEPGVEDIIKQMAGRLANSYESLAAVRDKKILDIACGSNTSKAPASLHLNSPFGTISFSRASKGYTPLFEPWFCRLLLEVGASPVGVDYGDLEQEPFVHYHVDLGKAGALNFLPDHSFDGIQDSRLFGSPEFTAQFPDPVDRLKVAQEIVQQERRLLKPDGLIIHSDAGALV